MQDQFSSRKEDTSKPKVDELAHSPLDVSGVTQTGPNVIDKITTRLSEGRLHDGYISIEPMGEYEGPPRLLARDKKMLLPARAPDEVVAYRLFGAGHSTIPRLAKVLPGDLVIWPTEHQRYLVAELHAKVVSAYNNYADNPCSFDRGAMQKAVEDGATFCEAQGLKFELNNHG